MTYSALALLSAFALNLVLTPIIIAVARKNKWYDEPDHRTVHVEPVPRLGGFGFVISTTIVAILMAVIFTLEVSPQFWLIFAGLTAFHIVGLVDDFVVIRPIVKLIGQLFATLLLIAGGVVIEQIRLPFFNIMISFGPIGPIITLGWIVAVTNAVNLIDGLDGLAGGLSFIIMLVTAVYFAFSGLFNEAIFALAAVGSVGAFLVYNKPKARIFMGDSGSLWLGAVLSVLPVLGGQASLFQTNVLLAAIMVAIPVLDTFAAIWRRIRDRVPIHSPDKKHLHHKLLNLGLSNWKILALIYSISAILGLSVISSPFVSHLYSSLIASFMWTLVGLMFLYIHFANKTYGVVEDDENT